MKNKSIFVAFFIVFTSLLGCEDPNKSESTPLFTVGFAANGGIPAPSDQVVKRGNKVDSPASMTKVGYGFGGWYKEAALINQWNFTVDTVTGNTTLYAKWNINNHTIDFQANGGIPVPSQQNIAYGSKIVVPSAMTKTGYGFGGWYKEAALINQWNFTDDTVTGNTTLYAKWELPITITGVSFAAKMRWLEMNAQSGGAYIIEFNTDESIGSTVISYSSNNISISLKGNGSQRIIRGGMFTIGTGVTLILENNLEIQGPGNTGFIINSGGTLIMNNGVKITGKSSSDPGGAVNVAGTFIMNGGEISGNNSTNYGGGGGVCVSNPNGLFIMNDGKISGNSTYDYYSGSHQGGNGVLVSSGTFIMNGGEISGNTSSNANISGGGVSIGGSGTFTMNGGEISGHSTSYGYGGGIYVQGTFTMNNGKISGNSALYGGGVYVDHGTFTMNNGEISGNTAIVFDAYYNPMGAGVCLLEFSIFNKTGGTIFGYTEGNSNSNVIKNNSGIEMRIRGHAVHVRHDSSVYIMGKDTTSGPTDNLSFNGRVNPPIWSGNWDY